MERITKTIRLPEELSARVADLEDFLRGYPRASAYRRHSPSQNLLLLSAIEIGVEVAETWRAEQRKAGRE